MTKKRKGRETPVYPCAPRISAALKSKYGFSLSARQILRDLKRVGVVSRSRRKHPAMQNQAARKSFAKTWSKKSAKRNVFSDEHFVSTNDHSSKRMFVQKGEKPLPLDVQRRQNVPSFQIWAAVGYNWRSPIVFFPLHDGPSTKGKKKAWRLNSRRYIDKCLSNPEVLRKLREPSTVFQQDGARPHTANIVKNFLREQGTTLMLGFPASSPDCNIIKAVWAILDRGISELMPRTQAELKKATIRAWEEIPASTINKLVLGFPKYLESIVKGERV